MHPDAERIGQVLTAEGMEAYRWMVIYPAAGGDRIAGSNRLVNECTPLEQATDTLREADLGPGEFVCCWRDCCGREISKMMRVKAERVELKVTTI